jgi:hypothetical protein
MRQVAGVVGSIGLLLAAWMALAPISVEVPHGDGRCGPSVVRYAAQEHDDDPNAQAVIDRCEDEAAGRLVVAGIAAGVGVVGFLGLRIAARRRDVLDRRRRRARREQAAEEAAAAAEHQARVEAAIARDAALRG